MQWTRLEAYARWKSRRFPLDKLPTDVLLHLATQYLSAEDACRMLMALYDTSLGSWDREQLMRLPHEFCSLWLRHHMLMHFRHCMHSLSERALYHARDATSIVVFADWTPYDRSCHHPAPVAQYEWVRRGCAGVQVHESHVLEAVARATRKRKPVVRLTMHGVLAWNNHRILHPVPLYVLEHQVFPAYLL